MFLEIWKSSESLFLIKLQARGRPLTSLKKRHWHRFFPANFVKFPRTLFLTEHLWWLLLEAVAQKCSVKYVPFEILQNPQENICARVSFYIKLQVSGLRPATLLKRRLWQRCFPEFCEISTEHFLLQNTSGGSFCKNSTQLTTKLIARR